MDHESAFTAGDDVLLLASEPGLNAPVPYEGRVVGEDAGGVLMETLAPRRATQEVPRGQRLYIPFTNIEVILLLEKKSEAELQAMRWEGHVRRQRVLDELDRIFFELAEKKGTYTAGPRPRLPPRPADADGMPPETEPVDE
jgi:hypothetical protein